MPVTLSIVQGVADLVIDGPIDLDWAEQFRRHASVLAREDGLRAVRVSARGRFFCPGGDLAWVEKQTDAGVGLHLLATTLHEGLLMLAELDAPVVAKVHAAAAGAGMSIVLAADFAIAGTSASFTTAYTGVGLSPDGGASWWLPRLVGHRQATEIMLTNRVVDADEAATLGIVSRCVPNHELDEVVDTLISQLVAGPTAAQGAVKRLLRSSARLDLPEQLGFEADTIAELGSKPSGREGINAFLSKRQPDFSQLDP